MEVRSFGLETLRQDPGPSTTDQASESVRRDRTARNWQIPTSPYPGIAIPEAGPTLARKPACGAPPNRREPVRTGNPGLPLLGANHLQRPPHPETRRKRRPCAPGNGKHRSGRRSPPVRKGWIRGRCISRPVQLQSTTLPANIRRAGGMQRCDLPAGIWRSRGPR